MSRKSGKQPISVVEAVNRALAEKLSDLGADMKCTEGARVLRVPGSRHAGTGEHVHILHDSGLTYSMSDLKAAVLPHSAEAVAAWKATQRKKTIQFNKQRKAWAAENAERAERKRRADDPCNIISLDDARAKRGDSPDAPMP